MERFWLPCPNLCGRIAERFGEALATLPQFVLEACREVRRGFGSPAPFRAADPPPNQGAQLDGDSPAGSRATQMCWPVGSNPALSIQKKNTPSLEPPGNSVAACPISCWRPAERFGEILAALPQFVLETRREVWRDVGNPAPLRAADPPPNQRARLDGNSPAETPRELGCSLLLPSHVHSRCQTRTLVLNLAGDEGCRVYTTHARARSPRHRQRQSLRLSLSQDSPNPSTCPPPLHRRQLTHPTLVTTTIFRHSAAAHLAPSLCLSLSGSPVPQSFAPHRIVPPVTPSPPDCPPVSSVPPSSHSSSSATLRHSRSVIFWVFWTPRVGACPTVTFVRHSPVSRQVWREIGSPAPVCAEALQRGLERFWQPCPISCCRPPPQRWMETARLAAAPQICWPVGSTPALSIKKKHTPSLEPRGNSAAACCCPPMCIPGVRLAPWC